MKESIQNLNNTADSSPVITGVIGTLAGWGAAAYSYLDAGIKVMTFIGVFFGAITACYTTIIVVRRYYIGCNDDAKASMD